MTYPLMLYSILELRKQAAYIKEVPPEVHCVLNTWILNVIWLFFRKREMEFTLRWLKVQVSGLDKAAEDPLLTCAQLNNTAHNVPLLLRPSQENTGRDWKKSVSVLCYYM